ncbi:MAG: hypothetical protein O3C01_01705 [Bacteroidetes bacterium]|nr:hypothetical protein [Bacteroidota bacterium]
MNYSINTKGWKIIMHVLAFLKQLKVSLPSLTKTVFLVFFLFTFFSCSEDYRKISSISEIEGFWGNDKKSFRVDVEKMIITCSDSTLLTLTSRPYDRSKITVSTGSIMLFDAYVFIDSSGSSIKISKINKKESSIYSKK